MEIRLKQYDVEAAVKAHLTRMGFDRPVTQMTFTAGRGGKGLTVEIEVSDPFTDSEDTAQETVATEPAPVPTPKSASTSAPAKATKAAPKAKTKPTAAPDASGEDDIQPDTDDVGDDGAPPIDDEPPFATSQAANETPAPATPKGKSLFG